MVSREVRSWKFHLIHKATDFSVSCEALISGQASRTPGITGVLPLYPLYPDITFHFSVGPAPFSAISRYNVGPVPCILYMSSFNCPCIFHSIIQLSHVSIMPLFSYPLSLTFHCSVALVFNISLFRC